MTSLQYSHQSRCPPLAVDSVTCPPVDSMEFHKKKSCSFAAKKLSTCSHDSSKLETEEKNFAINQSMTSQRTEFLKSLIDSDDGDCDGDFTVSGSNPPKTSGALGRQHDSFAKYARCGHWSTCKKEKCGDKKYFTPCGTCKGPAPFGPYGPWSKTGPMKFISPKADYIKCIYPIPKRPRITCDYSSRPMGKMGPWPLSGSCRYSGRPFGPCRPFGAYKNRGPFGAWTMLGWPESCRPQTPCQPCWTPRKNGCRPCTPCHRPLFRPCY